VNEYHTLRVSPPEGYLSFHSNFAKPERLSSLKRTLFLDLDDTLLSLKAADALAEGLHIK